MTVTLVLLFGVLGVASRYGLELAGSTYFDSFPSTTLLINGAGCALAGFFFVLGSERQWLPSVLTPALLLGFCGGFTTFSAYALQTVLLADRARLFSSLVYFVVSPALGLASCWVAVVLTRLLTSGPR